MKQALVAKTYTIQGMDCPNCARDLENGVGRLPGVSRVEVNFATGKMIVAGDVAQDVLSARVEALGKKIVDDPAAQDKEGSASSGQRPGFIAYLLAQDETRLALLGGVFIMITLLLSFAGLSSSLANAGYVVATLVALYPVARSGLRNLWINHDFNINLLMSIAAVGAIFIGETLEAATVIFLFAVGEALEGYNADRARHSIRSLMSLAPARAHHLKRAAPPLQSDAGSNVIWLEPADRLAVHEEIVPIEALNIGDIILVKPGDRIAMDGIVTAGSSSVNQAPITGESMPVHKSIDSEVFAGSVNGDGALEIRVTQRAADNTLSRIIQMVEEAQSSRAASQRIIDQFARYYTPGVVIIAVLVALIPPLLFGAPFYDVEGQAHSWLYRALTLLVIACPCALVISTPVTIISAITAAARRGVLIKGGVHLETLGQIRALAFDKTGTLTQGRPVVTHMRSVDCQGSDACAQCDDLLALASAVEQRSTHPLARAIVQAAESRGLDHVYAPAQSVSALAGRGVQGDIDGRLVTLGSHPLFDEQHPHSPQLCRWIDEAEANGETTVLLCDGERVRGFIAVSDEARAASRNAIGELNDLGLVTVMLTGDNTVAARAVAAQVGVLDVRAGLLPADKVSAVRQLISQHGKVGMVGDGINDTPALAAASVSVAMGGAGSAQALETADIALMADDLQQLPFAVRLARFSRRLIAQNIVLSLGMKLVFVALALTGEASLWAAVLADVGMSLLVTLNGMRPLRMAAGQTPHTDR